MESFKWISLTFLFLMVGMSEQNYTITPINSSSGLYYEYIGESYLSNNNWEFVTYIDYKDYLIFYQYIHQQAEKLREFCIEFNSKMPDSSECENKYSNLRSKLNDIDKTDEDMAHYLGIKSPRRVKRFWQEIGQFLSRIGRGIVGAVETIFGADNPELAVYEAEIRKLQTGQKQLANAMTLFTANSEKKSFQIDWLNATQKDIQQKMEILKNNFEMDSAEKAKQIEYLNDLFNETRIRQEEQQKVQKKLIADVSQIQETLQSVDNELEILNKTITENMERINATEVNIKLLSMSVDFALILDRFQTGQNTLYSAIIKAKSSKKGALDPSIISPISLIQMLQDTIPKLKEGERFPFYPDVENAHRLYNLIVPNVFISNNKLIFVFKMPLVKDKTFHIYKMNSLPVPIARKIFAFILPQEPFLLLDTDEREYMMLPQSEFEQCDRFGKDNYICSQKQYLHLVHKSEECEVQLYTSPLVIPNTCDKRIMFLEDVVFIQLLKKNSWIYVAPNYNTPLAVKCYPNKSFKSIEGSGFLHFSDDCKMYFENEELKPIIEYTKPVKGDFSPVANIADFIDLSHIKNGRITSRKHHLRISPFDWKKLDEISVSINNLSKYNANLYYLLLIPLAGLIIITVYIHYKWKMDYKKYKDYLSQRIHRLSMIGKKDENNDRLKMKVKLFNRNEKICRVSMNEELDENNPYAEYLTVRFKVQKDQNDVGYLEQNKLKNIIVPNNTLSVSIKDSKKACSNKMRSFADKRANNTKKAPIPTPKANNIISEINRFDEEITKDHLNYSNIALLNNDEEQFNMPQERQTENIIYDNVVPVNSLDELRKQKPRHLTEHVDNLRKLKPTQKD